MPKFTVRVELKGLLHDHPSYENLHQCMTEAGFSRVVAGDGGRAYHLPPGEYDIEGEHTKELVCQLARGAAVKVDQKFSVLVTKAASRVWYGLDPA